MADETKGRVVRRMLRPLTILALVLSILSSFLAIWAFIEARSARKGLQAFIEEGRKWRLSLTLKEPTDRAEIAGYVARIAGLVDFRTTATEVVSAPKLNLVLEEKHVKLVPFVKPLSEAKWWWAQANPLVREDGSFEGSVFIGDKAGAGVGVEFQLAVLAVPKGSVSEGDRLVNLPFSYSASNMVTVRRVR